MTYSLKEIWPHLVEKSNNKVSFNYDPFEHCEDDVIANLEDFFYNITHYGFDGFITIPAFKDIRGEQKEFPEIEFDLTVIESDRIFDSSYEGKTFLHYYSIIQDNNTKKYFKITSNEYKALDSSITSVTIEDYIPEDVEEDEDAIFFILNKANNTIHGMFDNLSKAVDNAKNINNKENLTIEKFALNQTINQNFISFVKNSICSYSIYGEEI